MYLNLKDKKFLIAHSNFGSHVIDYHNRREHVARDLGYLVTTFPMLDFFPYITFPRLDMLWKKRDKKLMEFYEVLGEKIDACDVFIHMNGALIHPDFLRQFNKLKIYHCADDPDASEVISKPVANGYDIHAISNPACLTMYRDWGCREVFFWPLGSPRAINPIMRDETYQLYGDHNFRGESTPLIYVGSKYGTARLRYVSRFKLAKRIDFLWKKKKFFSRLEKRFPSFRGYGDGWSGGCITDGEINTLYKNALIGINVHNSLGPINERLYDLAAFGVCQICDNKERLNYVFEEGKEIIGFSSDEECFQLIDYFLSNPKEAKKIGASAQKRFQKDYTVEALWLLMVEKISSVIAVNNFNKT